MPPKFIFFSNPINLIIRDIIKSSSKFFVKSHLRFVGLRALNTVYFGSVSPIFSDIAWIPRGVLKDPSSLPRPYFDVETNDSKHILPFSTKYIFCFEACITRYFLEPSF